MSKVYVNAVEPEGASPVLTLGAVGDTVNIAGTAGTGFPSAGFHNVKFITTSTNPVELTSGTTLIVVEVLGAGGCAGGANNVGAYGGCGGSGGYSMQQLAVVDSDEFNATIGAKGTEAGTRNGGDTTFAQVTGSSLGSTITAGGGVAGTNPAGGSGSHEAGGTGGVVTNANSGNKININGSDGAVGARDKNGPSTRWGTGGVLQATGTVVGGNAVGYGGGGGDSSCVNMNGGDGGDGLVVIWEYK